jgi:hypothetical protein
LDVRELEKRSVKDKLRYLGIETTELLIGLRRKLFEPQTI